MNCKVCGKELKGKQKRYCSIQCGKITDHRRRRGQAEEVRPRRSHLEWTDKDIQDRINTKASKIVYIGGYSGADSWIYVQCKDCGNMFKYSAQNLRRQRPILCVHCQELLSDIKERSRKENIERRAEAKHKEIIRKREEIYIRSHTRVCQNCGEEYFGTGKYCSEKCSKIQWQRNHDFKRRSRIKNNYSHDNISLKVLAKRDNDTCWLCEQKVDWTDFKKTKEGWFVAGANYPSIDHVQPLSKGGSHTWNNVRLSHRHCNTVKNNKLFGKNADGQVILFC